MNINLQCLGFNIPDQIQVAGNCHKQRTWGMYARSHGCMLTCDLQKICAGHWQIIVILPEMMLLKRFIEHVLRNPELPHCLLSVVVDEAHGVSHWGSDF